MGRRGRGLNSILDDGAAGCARGGRILVAASAARAIADAGGGVPAAVNAARSPALALDGIRAGSARAVVGRGVQCAVAAGCAINRELASAAGAARAARLSAPAEAGRAMRAALGHDGRGCEGGI